MNHEDAAKSMTAERYTLGELEPAERDAFEEHFFDCSTCADDVRDETRFAAGVRTAGAQVIPHSGRFTRWAAAAAIAAAAGIAYMYVPHVPTRNEVFPLAHVAVIEQAIELESARAASEPVSIHADQPVALYFIIPPPEHPAPLYTCDLLDATGRKIAAQPVSQQQAQNPVAMHLKAQTLLSGNYKVVIRDGEREIAAYPFTVQVR